MIKSNLDIVELGPGAGYLATDVLQVVGGEIVFAFNICTKWNQSTFKWDLKSMDVEGFASKAFMNKPRNLLSIS